MEYKKTYRPVGKFKNRATREYDLWRGVINRCTKGNPAQVSNPTYHNCTVSENFKDFQYFAKWCNEQTGFNEKDERDYFYQLDKDLITRDNKHYSEDTCCFIPKYLNTFLTTSKATRGIWPIGVDYQEITGMFRARYNKVEVAYIPTPEEAFLVYKGMKENQAKIFARELKDKLDPRAFLGLINYEVRLDD